MLRPAYFTGSLPTPPKEVAVILDNETEMLRVIPGQAIHLAHEITDHAPELAPRFAAPSPVRQPVNGV